jgi:putative transposase
MINPQHKLSLRKQCDYLDLNRSYVSYEPPPDFDDTSLANMIADIYRQFPVYGYRRITHQIKALYGIEVNHKRVLRMMQIMAIQAIYPKPCTSRKNHEHRVFPYLLKDYEVIHPHQVWQTDIT